MRVIPSREEGTSHMVVITLSGKRLTVSLCEGPSPSARFGMTALGEWRFQQCQPLLACRGTTFFREPLQDHLSAGELPEG